MFNGTGEASRRGLTVLAVAVLAHCTPPGEAAPDGSLCAWRQAASMGTARRDHATVLLNDGRLLVMGGFDADVEALGDTEIYDPRTDTWSPGPPLMVPRTKPIARVLPDGRIFVGGGILHPDPEAPAEVIDLDRGSSSAAGDLTLARGFRAAEVLADGRVLADVGPSHQMTLVVFDPTTNGWAPMAEPPTPLGTPTMLVDGDRVAVFAHASAQGDADVCPGQVRDPVSYWLDPVGEAWTPIATPPCYGTAATALRLSADRVLLFRGAECDLDSYCASEFSLDGTWLARDDIKPWGTAPVQWEPGTWIFLVANRAMYRLGPDDDQPFELPNTPFDSAHLSSLGEHDLLATSAGDGASAATFRCRPE